MTMAMEMSFYCTREADGTIHVQNAVMGFLGQHHVHTPEDFERWRRAGYQPVPDRLIHWLEAAPCRCGLAPGEVRQHA